MTVNVSAKVQAAIGVVIITVMLLSLTPVVVNAVQDMNTTGWTFTGADGAISLLGLVPFAWVAGVLLFAVFGMYLIATKVS